MSSLLKIGVTGHRKLKNIDELIKIVQVELKKISNSYLLERIISPLADGSDRIIAEVLMNGFAANLIVPLPFEKDEYTKDFSEDSKKQFDSYLEKASNLYEVDSLETNSRKECYFNVGKEVVNQCNVLIALWDGKPANGIGGTGDIVKYAKKKRKAILYINTNSLKVEYINFEGIL